MSESLKVIEGITLYKTEKWWSAVALVDAFGRNKSQFTCGLSEATNGREKTNSPSTTWLSSQRIKGAIEKLSQGLP